MKALAYGMILAMAATWVYVGLRTFFIPPCAHETLRLRTNMEYLQCMNGCKFGCGQCSQPIAVCTESSSESEK